MQQQNSKSTPKGNTIAQAKAVRAAAGHISWALDQLSELPVDLREEAFKVAHEAFYQRMCETHRENPLSPVEQEMLRTLKNIIGGEQ